MKIKMIYWISTILLSVILLWSAYTYFFQASAIKGFRELGFPDFFRIQLAIMKVIAVCILLIPLFPLQAKEWAYAGVGCFFITALVAHIVHKDSIAISILLVIFLAILALSNIYLHKLN